jgi:hypothetical protein
MSAPPTAAPMAAREPGPPSGEQPGTDPGGPPQPTAESTDVPVAAPDGRPDGDVVEAGTAVAVSPVSDGPGIAGRVEGPDRRAVVGAVLTVADLTGHQIVRGVSDADGRYRLGLATGGTYLLICAAENHQPVASMVPVGVGEVRRDLALFGASLVEGRVLAHDGEPISGATVTLTDARGEVVGAAVTGADGGYAVADLYPGDYTLTAMAERALPAARSVVVDGVGSHRVDVVLRSNATIAGTVRAAQSGRPVVDASVTLVDRYGNVAGSAVTGDDGRYEFVGLLPGAYTLTASGYPPVARRVDVAGEHAERDVALGDPGTPMAPVSDHGPSES